MGGKQVEILRGDSCLLPKSWRSKRENDCKETEDGRRPPPHPLQPEIAASGCKLSSGTPFKESSPADGKQAKRRNRAVFLYPRFHVLSMHRLLPSAPKTKSKEHKGKTRKKNGRMNDPKRNFLLCTISTLHNRNFSFCGYSAEGELDSTGRLV